MLIDHVAMILRFGSFPEDVFFMESTSNYGVQLTRWSSISQHVGNYYKKVAFRHLEWDRTDESLEVLE